MTDELNEPLGRETPKRATSQTPRRLAVLGVGAFVAAGAAALYLAPRDPFGGEPYAIAKIEPAKPPEAVPLPPPPQQQSVASADQGLAGNEMGVSEIEQLSGVKVTRYGGEGSSARIIRVDPPSGVKLAPAPDRRVVEKGRYGLLPRIGADGARPMDVYARPFVTGPTIKPGAPRIALVIGGLGLNSQYSLDALDQLPEGVTLAFAPYGTDLDRLVAQARARGHEALLQAPMEPFDYPQSNPGPHTLVTGAQDGGVDDLQWLMSRFTGYAGVMNYLGGRFMADEQAMYGALGEIAQRGLFFLDDGASPQSLAGKLAPKLSLPHARVDVIVDQRNAPQSIDTALAQLETLARDKGSAIGFANATPATVARIARFARDLERRGVALAPVSSTLAARGATADAGRGQ
ncbi:divergent polysaccharide deacetylase family protein [Methylocystis parvus]|uniref:Divergent polysaccharide deacetylase family protein n=1 Tax=Methylocystis parvus TaxID=134 RepID=A0A6B8M6M3_9HYPH|nr:divergent polysaccharide deacetylase family protein [Methylocystis parvus]QGM98118.1 divergent polysaccharide deacetylase family protein [Methylocystis parvus]WBK01561.1 divergent polysaccharide deacetylase family protein [Methylocystis parvus OBBP]